MLVRFLKRLWRERRRFAIVAALLMVMLLIHFIPANAWMFAYIPAWRLYMNAVIASGLTALIGAGVAVLLAVMIPVLRHLAECTALIFALLAVIGLALGDPGWMRSVINGHWLTGPALLFGILTLYLSSAGENLLVLRNRTVRARAHSRQPAEVLFDALAMRLDRTERARVAPGAELVALEPLHAGEDAPGADRRMTLRQSGALHYVQEQRITRFAPPRAIGYDFTVTSAAPDQPNSRGHRSLTITPHGRGHRVELEIRWDRLTWRQALMFWIDDAEGRALDAQIAAIGRPAPSAATPRLENA